MDDVDVPDTGESITGPVVDVGAYEFQAAIVPACAGDVDGDGVVGFSDLLALLGAWGACP